MTNIFEQVSRLQVPITFGTEEGSITINQLWSIKLSSEFFDNKEEDSLESIILKLVKTEESNTSALALEIARHVMKVRIEELSVNCQTHEQSSWFSNTK